MRILTWNINGLRAVLKRKYGKVKALLDDLEADIICFQETKLTKADFDRELALVEGWDSYFSINRGRSAYSGTATFCRLSAAPVAAQEGVTGILHASGESTGANDLFETGAVEGAETIWERHSREELQQIDSEGRCVVTDHGAFVLFNIYGPAISKEENAAERFAYKLEFYRALGMRMEALRKLGRKIVLVGDLNIAPAPIDSCDPGTSFFTREDRVWLRNLLESCGGPFVDVFRKFHPDRKEAYTCWQQASGARVNNWGTRIDLILAADGSCDAAEADQEGSVMHRLFTGSDIWPDLTGSDHCPVWADACFEEGLSPPPQPPAFSTQNTFTGKQNKLTAWLKQPLVQTSGLSAGLEASQTNSVPSAGPSKRAALESLGGTAGGKRTKLATNGHKQGGVPVQRSLRAFLTKSQLKQTSRDDACPRGRQRPEGSDPDLERAIAASLCEQSAAHRDPEGEPTPDPFESGSPHRRGPDSEELQDECGSGGLDAFGALGRSSGHRAGAYGEEPPDSDALIEEAIREADARQAEAESSQPCPTSGRAKQSSADAAKAWKAIQQKMKPPRCKGHNEECVIRQVKKKGQNSGRLFYVCRRADGPPPEGRCDFFLWSGTREPRELQGKSGSRKKQG